MEPAYVAWYDLAAKVIRFLHLTQELQKAPELGIVSAYNAWRDAGTRKRLTQGNTLNDYLNLAEQYRTTNDITGMLLLLKNLDERAHREYARCKKHNNLFDYQKCEHLEGLNSEKSREEDQILIYPRYFCIWEGRSRQQNHSYSLNTWLQYMSYAELKKGRIERKYYASFSIPDDRLYRIKERENPEGTSYLAVAGSPVTEHFRIPVFLHTKQTNGGRTTLQQDVFDIQTMSDEDERVITQTVLNVIRKADNRRADILVFPEGLGTENMVREVQRQLDRHPAVHLCLIILPSVWEHRKKAVYGVNQATILLGNGTEVCRQDKMVPYVLEHEGRKYTENIRRSHQINAVLLDGVGGMTTLICRSFLDRTMRNIISDDLGCRMFLCPSWTTGGFEFSRSAMALAETDANVIWVNCCSAELEKERPQPEELSKMMVGIATQFTKVRTDKPGGKTEQGSGKDSVKKQNLENARIVQLDMNEAIIRRGEICKDDCCEGCLFFREIVGRKYMGEVLDE